MSTVNNERFCATAPAAVTLHADKSQRRLRQPHPPWWQPLLNRAPPDNTAAIAGARWIGGTLATKGSSGRVYRDYQPTRDIRGGSDASSIKMLLASEIEESVMAEVRGILRLPEVTGGCTRSRVPRWQTSPRSPRQKTSTTVSSAGW